MKTSFTLLLLLALGAVAGPLSAQQTAFLSKNSNKKAGKSHMTAAPQAALALVNGPYLCAATSTGITVRWKTTTASTSRVRFGRTFANLDQTTDDARNVTYHQVWLTGLQPNTRYYYSVGSPTETLTNDSSYYFITPPLPGTRKLRIWAVGDCGTVGTQQGQVRNRFYNFIGNNYVDAMLLLGDNAYDNGTDGEYQTSFFNQFRGKALRQWTIYPTPGNHCYANSVARANDHNVAYYNLFSMLTEGQGGGVPSNNKAYYSYNIGDVHFVSMDSYGMENGKKMYDTTSEQSAWLKQDLAANRQKWTVVYWHHPPYTMGTHNSDTEGDLVVIRSRFIRMLERYKVDLVLCGHSHNYERSYLMRGHYGAETTFNLGTHAKSNSSGRYDGSTNSCPYETHSDQPEQGIVYVVAGSAAKLGSPQAAYPHNAMVYSDMTRGGSLYLEVDRNRIDGKLICSDGVIRDQFTIVKDARTAQTRTIQLGESVTLRSSFPGRHVWSNGVQGQDSITVSPNADTQYTVHDSLNCLVDSFLIKVNDPSAIRPSEKASEVISIKPNPSPGLATLTVKARRHGNALVTVRDANGAAALTLHRKVDKGETGIPIDLQKMPSGVYLISVDVEGSTHTLNFVKE